MWIKTFICVLAGTFAIACAPALAESTTTGSVAASGNVLIDARTPDYAYTIKLTVVGWDKSNVAVDQTSEKADGLRPNIERVGNTTKITATGGTLKAKSFFGLFKWGSTTWVNWTVHVPSRAPLEALSDNSSLQVSGVPSALTLRTSNGRITIEGGGPKVDAITSNGGVDATIASLDGIAPAIAIKTANGNVRLRVPADFHTRVDTHTYNGSVENPFSSVTGPGVATIRTANGDIVVTKAP